MRICMHNNQNGMVLVLAMFMLALLSMIGVASMMTTTTDIEIATGERQYVETFYRTQSAHAIAGELLSPEYLFDRNWSKGETLDTDGNPVPFEQIDDYTFAFRLIDDDILQEDFEAVAHTSPSGEVTKVWKVDGQTVDELPCPQDMTSLECQALDAAIGTKELDLWTDVRIVRMKGDQQIVLADIDIDKIRSDPMPGNDATQGADDMGSPKLVTFNIDARSRLRSGDFNKSPSRQSLGYRAVIQ